MAVTIVDQDRILSDLAAVWSSTGALLAELDEAEWTAPTCLPGWDVRSVVAHIIGTESMLLGEPTPEDEIDPAEYRHVRNDMGRLNEAWVVSMRDASPAELQQRFVDHVGRRLESLGAMSRQEWQDEGFTPAGRDSYGRFMRIRVFDCWIHEQDIRDAVGRPGHEAGPAVESVLDEMSAALGYVVGKRAAAPAGSRITFELKGDSGRTIHVEVGERAEVVDELSGEPSATITMPTGVFTRLGAGRVRIDDVRDGVSFGGDRELGERIVTNLTYTV